MTAAQVMALKDTNRVLTVTMRDLSTTTSGSFGPDSYGGYAGVALNGPTFAIDLHSDGHGDQVLAGDPFAAGPTYVISGLGMNYATFQIAYDAATGEASYYVNGVEVISGWKGYSPFPDSRISFGGEDSNFRLVELDTTS